MKITHIKKNGIAECLDDEFRKFYQVIETGDFFEDFPSALSQLLYTKTEAYAKIKERDKKIDSLLD
jgi:hypothetical protein